MVCKNVNFDFLQNSSGSLYFSISASTTFHCAIVWTLHPMLPRTAIPLHFLALIIYKKNNIVNLILLKSLTAHFCPEHPIQDIFPNRRPLMHHLLLNIVKTCFEIHRRKSSKTFRSWGELPLQFYLLPSVLVLWQPSIYITLIQERWTGAKSSRAKMKIYLIKISATQERVALTNVTFLRRGRVGRALDRVISLRSREQCQLALP